MIRRSLLLTKVLAPSWRRFASNESKERSVRFMQTIPKTYGKPDFYGFSYGSESNKPSKKLNWVKHLIVGNELLSVSDSVPKRRSRFAKSYEKASKGPIQEELKSSKVEKAEPLSKPVAEGTNTKKLSSATDAPQTTPQPKRRRELKPRKALLRLTSSAVDHLRQLLREPDPKMIRIGVKNRGCSGLTYHLEYVTEPGKFDETITQDGVKVLIDSKALFSIVGSDMDWLDDKLSSRFIFRNPNSKGTCGCGESFMV